MKTITATNIIDNINAKIALLAAQGITRNQPQRQPLQRLLDDICRHCAKIEHIDSSTAEHTAALEKRRATYEDNSQ